MRRIPSSDEKCGAEEADERRSPARPGGWTKEDLQKEGLAPATVIDVGAGPGTPVLYGAFPDAYHVLIEPLSEFEPTLRDRLTRRRGELLVTAVGEQQGEAVFHVNQRMPAMSSLLATAADQPQSAAPWEERRVPVATLDRLASERGWKPPFGLKIDTEGAEDIVIKGATEVLRETQFVIAEVWASARFEGGYRFAEFISLMDERGFELRDVLDAPRSRLTNEVMYLDVLFRPSRG